MNEQKMTAYLKLPFQFDESKLVHDLTLIQNNKWIPHFNTECYLGVWKVISLCASEGDERNIFAFSDNTSTISDTPIIKDCHYFKEVIGHFKCKLLSVRLLRLEVGASIKPHSDYNLGYEDNNFRLHIPIITNEDVNFVLDGTRLVMLPGECWYTNVNYVHSVSNKGKSDRIHLVIDCERNDWTDDLFFSLAPKESFFPLSEEIHSEKTLKRILEELKQRDVPAAKNLIVKLQEDLEKFRKME